MKQWWRRVRPFVLSTAIYAVARFIGRTLRLKVVGEENLETHGKGMIVCGWHGRSLIPANYFKGRGVWSLISHSRDGEMQTRIFKKFGFNVARGSTGRGGARAAIELIRILRGGAVLAMTPDGPRGPSGVVQDGVMVMAKKSGAALVPVGTSSKPGWYAPTWDNYLIPCAFGKASFVIGKPIFVPADADDAAVEELRLKLEQAIHEAQRASEVLIGSKPPRHAGAKTTAVP